MGYERYTSEGQSLFDKAIEEYQDLRLMPLMLFDNNLEPNAVLGIGDVLTFQEDVPALRLRDARVLESDRPLIQKMYRKVTEDGQSLIDLVIQEYGDVRLLGAVIADNNDPIVSENLTAGQSFSFRESLPENMVTDAETMDYFRRKEIRVNTHKTPGTGYWETIDGEYWETIDGEYWGLQNQ